MPESFMLLDIQLWSAQDLRVRGFSIILTPYIVGWALKKVALHP